MPMPFTRPLAPLPASVVTRPAHTADADGLWLELGERVTDNDEAVDRDADTVAGIERDCDLDDESEGDNRDALLDADGERDARESDGDLVGDTDAATDLDSLDAEREADIVGDARDSDGDRESVRLADRVALADAEGESDTVTGVSSRILFATTSATTMTPLVLLERPSRPTNDALRPSTDPAAPFPATSITASVVALMLYMRPP